MIGAFVILKWQVNERLAQVKVERKKQALQLATDVVLSEANSLLDLSANFIYLAKTHAPRESDLLTQLARTRLEMSTNLAETKAEKTIQDCESLTKDGDRLVKILQAAKLPRGINEHVKALLTQWNFRSTRFADSKVQYQKSLAEYEGLK